MASRLKVLRSAYGSQPRLIHELQLRAARRRERIATPASLKVMLSRWENGHTTPAEPYRSLLCEIFGATSDELFGPDAAPDASGDLIDELREHLDHAHGTDGQMTALLHGQTDQLRLLDRRLGAPALLGRMRDHIECVSGLLRHSVLSAQRQPLAAVLADAGALAGWQSLDVGAAGKAWHYYELAKAAAREAESPVLLAHAMGEQAYALLDLGRPADAVALVREALSLGNGQLPPLLRCWLTAAEAELLAAGGQGDACRRKLDRADDLLPAENADPTLPFLMLNDAHLSRWLGSTLARLGDGQAIDHLYAALRPTDRNSLRAEAGLRCDLAQALTVAGRQDEAQDQAAKARELVRRVGSVRQRRRLDRLGAAAA